MTNTTESVPSTSRATPRRGAQRFSLNVNRPPTGGEPVDDSLNELLFITWTVFGVSILFNFHRDQVHLKRYAKRLREEVASKLVQENVVYNAKFSVLEDMTPNSLDSPLKIEVYSKANRTTEDSHKCIYKGILLSWKDSGQKLVTPNSVRLPVLLCRGMRGAVKIVHQVLSQIFDCTIIPLPIGEDDLMWLVPIIIFPTDKEKQINNKDEVRMEYRIPELPDSDTITIKFQASDLIKILEVILDTDKNETDTEVTFSLEHIEKFRQVLYTEMLKASNLQLGLCTLHKVNLPGVTVMGNKMKSMNIGTMDRILMYVNNKAYDTLYAINSGLS